MTSSVNLKSVPALEVKDNGDYKLTDGRVYVAIGIDGTGGVRQIDTVALSVLELLGKGAAAGVAGVLVPVCLLGTGAACTVTSVELIPEAVERVKSAEAQLKQIQHRIDTYRPSFKYLYDQNSIRSGVEFENGFVREFSRSEKADLLGPLLDPEKHRKFIKKLENEYRADFKKSVEDILREAKEIVEIEKIGVVNMASMGLMGMAQVASGIVAMLGPEMAHTLNYSSVLGGTAAATATLATTIGLAAVYIFRGALMVTRTTKNLRLLNDFEKRFNEHCNSIDEAIDFIEKEKEKGLDLKRKGVPERTEKQSDVDYLKAVNKGIYTEKLKQYLSMLIGWSMIIGGILAIIGVSVASGGIAPIVIGLVSAVFFLLLESAFVSYDTSKAFEWIRDKLYKEPELFDRLNREKLFEDFQIVDFKPLDLEEIMGLKPENTEGERQPLIASV